MKDDPPVAVSPTSQAVVGQNGDENERQEQGTIPRREAEQSSLTSAVIQDQNNSGSRSSAVVRGNGDQSNRESKASDRSTGRPRFKDQVRGEADARNTLLAQGDRSIPLAQSVHIVVGNEHLVPDPPATNTQPAEVLPTYPSGINAIVETFKNQLDGEANPPGINGEDPGTITPPAEENEIRKHIIWAGSFLLAIVVIAITIAVILTSGGGSGNGSDVSAGSIEDQPPPASTPVAPPPSVEPSTEVPSTLVFTSLPVEPTTDVPTFRNALLPSTVEPSSTSEPVTPPLGTKPSTEVPSVLVFTSLPVEPTTDVPTIRNTLSPSTVEPLEIKLIPSDGAADDLFGVSVAIDGDTLVIGASSDDTAEGVGIGSAYVYNWSGIVWTELAKLTASDGAENDGFGYRVAIDGNTIVIGARNDDTENGTDSGSVYVYTLSGSVWTMNAKLTASDSAADDAFGDSVAINGGNIVIGASWDDTENGVWSGSAYVYTLSGTGWTELAKLTAIDGAEYDYFGYSVAINGDTIVIGAYNHGRENGSGSGSGIAYVFTRSGTIWTEQAKLSASFGAIDDLFGETVAINGDTIVIGASEFLKPNYSGGGAYVYRWSGSFWTEQAKLTASDGTANDDYFGISVAIDGDTIVIGAFLDDTEDGTDSGSAYVYTYSGTVWTEQAKLTASDGASSDSFGRSVAVNQGTIVVGASGDDEDRGSAYVYSY